VSREKPDSPGGGLQVQTLLISAVSAVAAATIVPLFWQRGTIIATAMTPVIVALVSEALRRPAERIKTAAPRVARRTATGAAVRRFDPAAAQTRHPERVGARGAGPERFEPLPGAERTEAAGVSEQDPFGLRRPQRRRSWWRIGIATGALAFVIGAGIVTASELAIFGGSITGGNERTSLFGGKTHKSTNSEASPKRSAPKATATPRASATPTATGTPAPTSTPTPTSTPAPTTTPPAAQPSPTP
jgi:hypothetical protein